MYLSPALVAGAFAASASAFLLPLEVTESAEQAKSDILPFLGGAKHTVELDCPGCPFFGVEDTTRLQPDVENHILLDFGVDAAGALTINQQPVLTKDPSESADPFVITASQIRVQDHQQTRPIKLDFALERLKPIHSEANPNFMLLPIQFTILALEGHPVKVDTVAVDLLPFPEKTLIAKVTSIPFKDTPGATTCDTSSRWSICRLRAILAARLQAMIEAAKARALAAKGWVKGQGKGCRGKFGSKGGPGGMRHGHGQGPHGFHGGHRHHHAHRFGRLLQQTLRFFVIPALLGVIGGLLASAIGMLVGHFITFLWMRFHRRGRRGHVRVVEIVVEEDEKDALIIEDDVPPPQYEDADMEAVVGEDEKK